MGAQDLVDLAKEERSLLFSQPEHAPWESFKAAFQECIFVELAAELFNIEAGSPWPLSNCAAIVSCVPRPQGKDDDGEHPSVVVPLPLRCPIHLQPVPVYMGLRYRQPQPWRNKWLPDSMHGARPKHETSDVSYELALQLEAAAADYVIGVSLDRHKFFYLLPHEICHNLLEALGMLAQILTAERNFYKQLSNSFKLNTAISGPCLHANGFVQGCSHSLSAAQAILCVWTRRIEATPSRHERLNTRGFLDDSNFRVQSDNPDSAINLPKDAWQRSLQFDALALLQTNIKKTILFANAALAAQAAQQFSSGGEKLKSKKLPFHLSGDPSQLVVSPKLLFARSVGPKALPAFDA